MKKYLIVITGIIAVNLSMIASNVNGYLKTNGIEIVNGANQSFLIRAMGPGGWMLQEGYMFGTPVGTQHEIRAMLENLTDKASTDAFYEEWLTHFFTEKDVELVAEWGFNSIRVPLHYNLFTLPIEQEPLPGENTWLEKGFTMVDDLLSWCEKYDLYLILDLHGAPGGQGRNADISDYDPSKPSLWESAFNQQKTVALWHKLAERYSEREYIGGYDLINETNWGFDGEGGTENGCGCAKNAPLLNLYQQIIDAIRSVDQNHLIFIEGNCWANDFTGLESLAEYDSNLAFSFHKYWTHNTDQVIDGLLQMRTRTQVPLWLGETGENSNTWMTDMVKQMERLNIGWSTWAYKQMDLDDPFSIETDKWSVIKKYNPATGANKPTYQQALEAMNDMIEKIKTENCKFNPDVVYAITGTPFGASRKPYKSHTIPGLIFATDYDMGAVRDAWYDKVYQNNHVSTSSYTAWNEGYVYRNDGVDMEACKDVVTNGYGVGWTDDGEWLRYTVEDAVEGYYNITFRVASYSSKINLRINNKLVSTEHIVTPHTGGYQIWKDVVVENVYIPGGPVELTLLIIEGGLNLNYLSFDLATINQAVSVSSDYQIDNVSYRQGELTFKQSGGNYPPQVLKQVELYNMSGQMLYMHRYNITVAEYPSISINHPMLTGSYILRCITNCTSDNKTFMVIN